MSFALSERPSRIGFMRYHRGMRPRRWGTCNAVHSTGSNTRPAMIPAATPSGVATEPVLHSLHSKRSAS